MIIVINTRAVTAEAEAGDEKSRAKSSAYARSLGKAATVVLQVFADLFASAPNVAVEPEKDKVADRKL